MPSSSCLLYTSNLLESIFFGTEKGAYTGAENRKGLFELAEGGTLFLDEINSMSVSMQVKLLKAIEEKKFRRIGGQREIKVDIRIISALNEDPLTLIAEKRLRPDLFYRLGNIYLTIPPLCERKGDIKHLTDYFMKEYQEALRLPAKGISDHVLSLFQKYSWPGNVRELKNALESALTVSTGRTIETHDLPEYLKKDLLTDEKEPLSGTMQDSSPDEDVPEDERTLREKLENYERNLIMAACEKYSTRVEAAKHLGISKQSLNYLSLIHIYDILLVDQRAHGQSEGKTISFGINERCDLLSWLQYVDARFGADEYRIILSGVSMGAATVLMAAELALPAAVKGIIADCGYTSPRAIIRKVMKDAGLCPALLYPFVRLAARLAGGFDLDEASAVESVRHCRVPVLIIHGEADGFVPCSMAREIYAACACDKELLLVPGADHVMSYIVDTKRYEETVRRFIADCLSRP